jgi:hypothetical protein
MSQQAVERTLGKLVTDPSFRDGFYKDPAGASSSVGLELSGEELRALSRLPITAISRFSLFLDDRIAAPPLDGPPESMVAKANHAGRME